MSVLFAGAAGSLLGIAYFGHLWLHVQRLVQSGRGFLLHSALLRLGAIGIGLFLLGRTGGSNLVAALAGLQVTRTIVVWRVGRVSGA